MPPVGAPGTARVTGMPGWVMGRARRPSASGAGRGMPAGPGMGWGTPAVGAGRAGCTGAKVPVAAGRATPWAWADIGWLGRGTDDAGGAWQTIAGRGGNMG